MRFQPATNYAHDTPNPGPMNFMHIDDHHAKTDKDSTTWKIERHGCMQYGTFTLQQGEVLPSSFHASSPLIPVSYMTRGRFILRSILWAYPDV
jgi:hypothetical protein